MERCCFLPSHSGTIAFPLNIIMLPRINLKGFCRFMAASNIDEIDRQILAELQDDGQMTNVELAKKVGLTAPPCLRRVRSLEDSGAIKSYHAMIDPADRKRVV